MHIRKNGSPHLTEKENRETLQRHLSLLSAKQVEKLVTMWSKVYCPQCTEPIVEEMQIRCHNCKVLFDWEDSLE